MSQKQLTSVIGKKQQLSLRERSKLGKAERIRAAAEQLLSERSIEKITTREVAELAGIGEATLFRYIGSKRELLMMVYGDQMDAILTKIEREDAVLASSGSLRRDDGEAYCNRIYSIYRARCEFYRRNPDNAALYMREGFQVGSVTGARNIAQGDRSIRMVGAILAEGQSHGALVANVDPYLVAQNCHGIFIHEIDRTPVRGFTPQTIWDRTSARLSVQLSPLIIHAA
ncbi:TetR/AcrR family transcriptional regulator [Pseudarthrobacter enclensis]|uniref:AcrR family transcriptional regulator n=1 Tax=Pseudarthrobacter enclensis TaxID=993070 RepID=A0ABT9RXM7_9MICC|nr:TetR/AcrR family transcriptional regulator [Pseudarthrobacter enclensis]MDP9890001.1 AcrR family transcriptional regulator [Pseudarthrobacter enclensis]